MTSYAIDVEHNGTRATYRGRDGRALAAIFAAGPRGADWRSLDTHAVLLLMRAGVAAAITPQRYTIAPAARVVGVSVIGPGLTP